MGSCPVVSFMAIARPHFKRRVTRCHGFLSATTPGCHHHGNPRAQCGRTHAASGRKVVHRGNPGASLLDLHRDYQRIRALYSSRLPDGAVSGVHGSHAKIRGDRSEISAGGTKGSEEHGAQGEILGRSPRNNCANDCRDGRYHQPSGEEIWAGGAASGPSHPWSVTRKRVAQVPLGAWKPSSEADQKDVRRRGVG